MNWNLINRYKFAKSQTDLPMRWRIMIVLSRAMAQSVLRYNDWLDDYVEGFRDKKQAQTID